MTEPDPESPPPKAEGELLGIPYDLRAPTAARIKSRTWNKDDRRMFPPKVFGWGYTINFYWVVHPLGYFRHGRGTPAS